MSRVEEINQKLLDNYFRTGFLLGLQYGRDNPAYPDSLSRVDNAALEGALAEHKAINHKLKENSAS